MRGLREAAPRSDAAAARLAQLLLDSVLPRQEGGLAAMLGNLVSHQRVPKEQPWDAQVIWSSVLPSRAVGSYGPNLLVIEPSARGSDLNYLGELLRKYADSALTPAAASPFGTLMRSGAMAAPLAGTRVDSCSDVPRLHKYDTSDVGQVAPSSLARHLYRGCNLCCTGLQPP